MPWDSLIGDDDSSPVPHSKEAVRAMSKNDALHSDELSGNREIAAVPVKMAASLAKLPATSRLRERSILGIK
jgi:hypothetical protein